MKPDCIKKHRLFVGFVVAMLILSLLFYHMNVIDESVHKLDEWSNGRCLTELSWAKFQLNEVTDYRDKIDQLLKGNEKKHKLVKDRFQKIIGAGLATKEKYIICQSQYAELHSQCIKINGENYKLRENIKNTKLGIV